MSLREQILQHTELKTETVDVPEWNTSVMVRELTGTERDSWESAVMIQNGDEVEMNMTNARSHLAIRTIIDPDTMERVFEDGDVDVLGGTSARALDRVFSVASRLSGLTKQDMDELVKNLDSAQTESSGSL